MTTMRLAKAFFFSLALAGCETAVSGEGSSGALMEHDWVAVAIAGKPVVKAGHVTLSFTEDRVSGRSGCNLYSGPVELGPGTIKVGALISTKMACQESGVMAQENDYLNAMRSARSFTLSDERLTIATASGDLVYNGVPRQVRP
jgi:heat shock protein HslJ